MRAKFSGVDIEKSLQPGDSQSSDPILTVENLDVMQTKFIMQD